MLGDREEDKNSLSLTEMLLKELESEVLKPQNYCDSEQSCDAATPPLALSWQAALLKPSSKTPLEGQSFMELLDGEVQNEVNKTKPSDPNGLSGHHCSTSVPPPPRALPIPNTAVPPPSMMKVPPPIAIPCNVPPPNLQFSRPPFPPIAGPPPPVCTFMPTNCVPVPPPVPPFMNGGFRPVPPSNSFGTMPYYGYSNVNNNASFSELPISVAEIPDTTLAVQLKLKKKKKSKKEPKDTSDGIIFTGSPAKSPVSNSAKPLSAEISLSVASILPPPPVPPKMVAPPSVSSPAGVKMPNLKHVKEHKLVVKVDKRTLKEKVPPVKAPEKKRAVVADYDSESDDESYDVEAYRKRALHRSITSVRLDEDEALPDLYSKLKKLNQELAMLQHNEASNSSDSDSSEGSCADNSPKFKKMKLSASSKKHAESRKSASAKKHAESHKSASAKRDAESHKYASAKKDAESQKYASAKKDAESHTSASAKKDAETYKSVSAKKDAESHNNVNDNSSTGRVSPLVISEEIHSARRPKLDVRIKMMMDDKTSPSKVQSSTSKRQSLPPPTPVVPTEEFHDPRGRTVAFDSLPPPGAAAAASVVTVPAKFFEPLDRAPSPFLSEEIYQYWQKESVKFRKFLKKSPKFTHLNPYGRYKFRKNRFAPVTRNTLKSPEALGIFSILDRKLEKKSESLEKKASAEHEKAIVSAEIDEDLKRLEAITMELKMLEEEEKQMQKEEFIDGNDKVENSLKPTLNAIDQTQAGETLMEVSDDLKRLEEIQRQLRELEEEEESLGTVPENEIGCDQVENTEESGVTEENKKTNETDSTDGGSVLNVARLQETLSAELLQSNNKGDSNGQSSIKSFESKIPSQLKSFQEFRGIKRSSDGDIISLVMSSVMEELKKDLKSSIANNLLKNQHDKVEEFSKKKKQKMAV